MPDTFGLKKILNTEYLKSVIPDAIKISDTEFKRYQVKLESCFKKYITRTHSKYSKIKTLLYRDKPVKLLDHYVPTNFKCGKKIHDGGEIFYELKKNKRNVILGTAGSGKSVLLRKIVIDIINNKEGTIPALLELRLLITKEKSETILDHLYRSISDQDEGFTKDQLITSLKIGKIALFLDGFDEIDYEKRQTYEREILEISDKYPNTILVISSRPDELFNSWEEFHIFSALPLNEKQSIELVSKIDYEKSVKETFITQLKDGLFKKHIDFLSSPLLLTMMLLTFEQLAEIPEKIHIFYEQAFDTLYHKHDALKSQYKRKSYSNLPIDDFKRLFSAFCIITFYERKMIFSDTEILEYLAEAVNTEDITCEPTKIFNDLLKSVCIIQKDGNTYTFSHRSFQEYFAAVFLSRSQTIDLPKALNLISIRHHTDNVISLAWELNRERLETLWIQPKLKRITREASKFISSNDPQGFLALFYSAIVPHSAGNTAYKLSENKVNGFFYSWLVKLYNDISIKYWPRDEASKKEWEKMSRDFLNALPSLKEKNGYFEIPLSKSSKTLPETEIILKDCKKRLEFLLELERHIIEKYNKKEKTLTKLLKRAK
ncbi:NACHT domain-containing protein [Pseudomonas aeruginosa]